MENRGSRSSIVHLLSSVYSILSSRVYGLAAIDDQGVAGNERSFVRSEKQHGVSDFLGAGKAIERAVQYRQSFLLFFRHAALILRSGRHTAKARRLRGSRANAVGADALHAVIDRHLARQVDHRRFGRTVGGVFFRRKDAEGRRRVDDVAASLSETMRQ